MKPVTELWDAAFEVWDESEEQERRGLARLGRAVVALQDAKHGGCLEVLDLVATSNRLGLVRWVLGMSDSDLNLLGGALTRDTMRLGTSESREHALKVMREYGAAFSGNEGGAKCPECHGAGKVKRLEGGGSIRVVKYDPCPKCAEGDGGSKAKPKPIILPAEEETHELGPRLSEVMRQIDEYEGDDREHRAPQALLREADELAARLEAATPTPTILHAGKPPTHTSACVDGCACRAANAGGKPDCQACPWGMPIYGAHWRVVSGRVWCRHQHEYERMLGSAAKSQQPEKRILPAGKPPPFLRVGMVLKEPTANRLWTIQEVWQVGSARCTCPDAIGGWWACDVLLTWPLAEDFAVEGEA